MISDQITPENSALVLVDFNQGLMAMLPPNRKRVVLEGAIALSKIGKLFQLPTIVLGKGAEDNFGPLMAEVDMPHEDAPHPVRHTLSAWNTPAFVEALQATSRKKIVIAGVAKRSAPISRPGWFLSQMLPDHRITSPSWLVSCACSKPVRRSPVGSVLAAS